VRVTRWKEVRRSMKKKAKAKKKKK